MQKTAPGSYLLNKLGGGSQDLKFYVSGGEGEPPVNGTTPEEVLKALIDFLEDRDINEVTCEKCIAVKKAKRALRELEKETDEDDDEDDEGASGGV